MRGASGALDEYAGAVQQDERLAALAEYAEIRARRLAGSADEGTTGGG